MKATLVILAAGVLVCQPALAVAAELASSAEAPASGSSGCGKPLAADMKAGATVTRTVKSGGDKRSYLLHLPANYQPGTPVPLVFNFHGFGSNPEKQNDLSAFVPVSDREGFILVTPDGGIGWRFAESARSGNTAFVRDLVTTVNAELCVDSNRIYATGKSQGGFMASWLGCAAPDVFAAIAPVAGMYEPTGSCTSIPIVQFHGKADKTIPFSGGHVLVLGNYPGAVAVMQEWARLNGCTGAPDTVAVTPHVQRVTYQNCSRPTIQYITDAGHTWPGTTVREGDDSTPADLPASELIWAFFKANPKR